MADAFHIDWAALTASTIIFPQESLALGSDYFVAAGEEFFYVRQIRYSQNYSWIPATFDSRSLQEHVYFIAQNTIPITVFTKNISNINNTAWKHADVIANTTGSYLYTEMDVNQGSDSFKTVNVSALSRQQAIFNNDYNDTFTSETVNDEVQVCPPGCIDCDCTGCKNGYAYDTLTLSCSKCGPGCYSCDVFDPSKCLSCTTGLFYDANTSACLECDPTCLSCGVNATTCEVCYPGWTFNANQQCNQCPLNCFNCSSSTVCNQCDKGYGLTPNGTCRKCMSYCSECNPDNITECTSCAQGLELRSGRCYSCPLNCLECTSTACVLCTGGYTLNTNSVCVLQCELPCVTCLDNNPTLCTACQTGSYRSGYSCILNTTCNNDNTCTYCGQGLGFFLVPLSGAGGYCSACPNISNCLQCNENNAYYCSVCRNAHYLETNGTCSSCHSNCTLCVSNVTCTACSAGWTISSLLSDGQCLACDVSCMTCYGQPNLCTACNAGYIMKGTNCRNSTYIYFRFVLTISITVALGDIDNIIIGIYLLLLPTMSGASSYDTSFIDIDELTSGSTVLTGSATPPTTTTTLQDASVSLSSGLASGLPGTSYVVSSSDVSIQSASGSELTESGMGIGIIAGAAAGGIILIVIIVVIVCVKRKKAQMASVTPIANIEDNEIMIL